MDCKIEDIIDKLQTKALIRTSLLLFHIYKIEIHINKSTITKKKNQAIERASIANIYLFNAEAFDISHLP